MRQPYKYYMTGLLFWILLASITTALYLGANTILIILCWTLCGSHTRQNYYFLKLITSQHPVNSPQNLCKWAHIHFWTLCSSHTSTKWQDVSQLPLHSYNYVLAANHTRPPSHPKVSCIPGYPILESTRVVMFEPFSLAVLIDGMFVVAQNTQFILVGRNRKKIILLIEHWSLVKVYLVLAQWSF